MLLLLLLLFGSLRAKLLYVVYETINSIEEILCTLSLSLFFLFRRLFCSRLFDSRDFVELLLL